MLIFVFIMCSVLGARGLLEKILSKLLHSCVWMLTDYTCHISFLDRFILTFCTTKCSPLSRCLRLNSWEDTSCSPLKKKKRQKDICCLAKWCQRIWIISISPCPVPLLPFFHHQDVLVCNSILSSRSCTVLIHPWQPVHEIKMHAQPRIYLHVLCTWEKQMMVTYGII